MLRGIVAIGVGAACGVGFFYTAKHLYVAYVPRYDRWDVHYQGTLVSRDAENKTLVMRVSPQFPSSEPALMRFSYTDATPWTSIAYLFRDGALVSRSINTDAPVPTLPEGTLMMIVRKAGTADYRAAYITYLRKVEL